MSQSSYPGSSDGGRPIDSEITPQFDFGSIAALGGGDQVLVERLVVGVIQSLREDLLALERLLAKGDRLGLAALAHRVKGTAKLVNAVVLEGACNALEVGAGHVSLTELQADGDRLCDLLLRMEIALFASFPGAQEKL